MTLQQLRDFVAVVTHGGYRPAARVLDVAQAGLTKSIARLEQEYGVALLYRQSKGVTLSAAGATFLRYAQAVILDADRAEAWLRAEANAKAEGATTLMFGVSTEPSLQLMPAVLSDFRRAMPNVALRMTQRVASALLAGVRESRLELAVTRLPPGFEDRDLVVQPLFESEAVVVARADHPVVTAGQPVDHTALTAWDWVVFGDTSQPAESDTNILEMFDARGLSRPHVAAVTDSLFEVVAMLTDADLLALLPSVALTHPLVDGRLRQVALRDPTSPRYTIAIVHKASVALSPAARTLAAMVASMVRSRALAERDR